jgi:hypothetical protein
MTRDQMPVGPTSANLSSPGAYAAQLDQGEGEGEEINGSPVNSGTLLNFVELCLSKLEGEERERFIGALHNLLQPNGGGNQQASDRRIARDRRGDRQARDRRIASDRAATVTAINRDQGFFQRFPDARKISFSSTGR